LGSVLFEHIFSDMLSIWMAVSLCLVCRWTLEMLLW
jgi:hypothetical protein